MRGYTRTNLLAQTARRTSMHIVTVAEMRELETRADHEYGLTSHILMENAGKSTADILVAHINRIRSVAELEFLILVGPGNFFLNDPVTARFLAISRRLVILY